MSALLIERTSKTRKNVLVVCVCVCVCVFFFFFFFFFFAANITHFPKSILHYHTTNKFK